MPAACFQLVLQPSRPSFGMRIPVCPNPKELGRLFAGCQQLFHGPADVMPFLIHGVTPNGHVPFPPVLQRGAGGGEHSGCLPCSVVFVLLLHCLTQLLQRASVGAAQLFCAAFESSPTCLLSPCRFRRGIQLLIQLVHCVLGGHCFLFEKCA